MYKEEVLKKVPVVQHFKFGRVLRWRRAGDEVDLESSGDGIEEEEEQEDEKLVSGRERDEGTVAPWALPSLSGTIPPRRSPVPSPLATATGRQLPTSTSTTTTVPKPFVPPALFPGGNRSPSSLSNGTVGEQGGAAASTSPFGVLGKVGTGKSGGNGGDALRKVDQE